MPPPLYAHTRPGRPETEWELLTEHLVAVADRAASFAAAFGAGEVGRCAGLLHDLGKASERFQAYLRGEAQSTDHSSAGAQLACSHFAPTLGKLIAYAVSGHHSGLADGQRSDGPSLAERLGKAIEPHDRWREAAALPQDIPLPQLAVRDDRRGFQLAFFTRMLFSCLVDADRLETERFLVGRARDLWPSLVELAPKLDQYLCAKARSANASDVNRERARILAHVRGRADLAPGLFSLTVPTGGGKTLTSLAWALDHAIRHGLERVVYVIPFTSIVEQTATVFREALGEEAVLEHHSAFHGSAARPPIDEEELRCGSERHRQATETWDVPVVVTTAVQLFESLFAAAPGPCRKLHNLARAVIVLDEAQTLPLHLLQPCLAALDELARNYRTSVVLMTATQPALQQADLPGGLRDVRELAPPHLDRVPAFRRVRLDYLDGLDDAAVADRLRRAAQVLCIVNTRHHARSLYEAIRGEEGVFHLSTLMCATHRRRVLATVRERLAARLPVRLVATSLIEAGVDVSFPLVLRAEAGLDQIAQAAGRCNREGELAELGVVHVFASACQRPPPELEQRAAAGRAVLRQGLDPLSDAAVQRFFRELYTLKGVSTLDRERVMERFEENVSHLDFPFASVAERFRMIEQAMVPVLIPYDDAASALLADLERLPVVGRTARRLQPYTAQVPCRVRGALLAAGAARPLRDADHPGQFVVLANRDLYREDVGLTWDDPSFLDTERLIV